MESDPGAAEAVPVALAARPAIEGETRSRVGLSAAALELLQRLVQRHGPLMFHQSGGCCDGSAPMCYQAGEFLTGGSDVLLGVFELPGADGEDGSELEFWMSQEQFAYWRHTHLLVDAVRGRGAGFSLEGPTGMRFLIRSTLLPDSAPPDSAPPEGPAAGATGGGEAAPGEHPEL